MHPTTKIALVAIAAAALVAAPLAMAAPGGSSGEHADRRAAKGLEEAHAASTAEHPSQADNATTDADDDAPSEHSDRSVGSADHPGNHTGWAQALLHVPAKVKAFFERVLAGEHPREANPGHARDG